MRTILALIVAVPFIAIYATSAAAVVGIACYACGIDNATQDQASMFVAAGAAAIMGISAVADAFKFAK